MRTALKVIGIGLVGLLVAAAVAAAVLMRPLGAEDLRSQPTPAEGYAESTARIAAAEASESAIGLSDAGGSIALTHGSRTETAVVIFHGFTDVPKQFELVARGFYDAGANVYVPRAPFHGYADRMTADQSKLTPDELRRFADESIDVAQGLGDKVVVVGFSGGGSLAMWAATQRPDVDQAVIMSPLVLPAGYRPWMVRPASRALLAMPDSYNWWTDKQGAEPGPEYPRYSLHGIASYLLLAQRAATGSPAGNPDVVVVANLGDPRLDTARPIEVMRSVFGSEKVRVVEIPASEGLSHDIVGFWGENRPKLRGAYRYLEDAFGVTLPDPLSEPEPQR